jgi:multiple sugar transport system permease protein
MATISVPAVRARRRMSAARRRDLFDGLLFASPFVLGVLFFWLGPMIYSLYLVVHDWNLITPPRYAGLRNVERLFNDPLVGTSLTNTAFYTFVGVPLQLTVAFSLALMLNQAIRGRSLYRTIFYMPAITPAVASAVVWVQILNPEFGVLNAILGWFGIGPVKWLFDPTYAKPALILMSLWFVGPQMVVFLAGLQGVPQTLLEAASIDGANSWRRFWHVTVPIVSPVIFFNLIIGIIGSFQVFTQAFVMTQGGPRDATLFFVLYIYRNAFQYFRMGYAATLAWVLFAIIVVFTAIQFLVARRWVYYAGKD